MITIYCKTNLDLSTEKWPTKLPSVPNVGDFIQSAQVWDNDFQLRLEVYSVTWVYLKRIEDWVVTVELHIPKQYKFSITDFYNWYAPKVGCSVSAFI
jgi:hypothetical protein